MASSFRERLDAWNQCVAMLLFFGAIGPIGTLVLMTSPHVAKVDRDVWMVVGLFCIMFFGGLIMRAVGPCLIEEPEDGNFGDWSALNHNVMSIILGFLSFEDARNLSLTDKETLRKIRNIYMLNTIWKINPVVFFQDINGNGSWKRNIRRIQLVDDFNRPLDLRLVPKLTSLNLGYSFNQELNLEHVTNLTTLDLGAHFNQPLNLEHVTNLTSLYLGWDFNQELNLEHVTNLTSLHLGHDFKQPMNLEHVRNLTTLRLGWDFNQELNLEPVPNLTSLHLGVNFNQAIRVRNGVVVHYSKGYQRNLVTFY